jgi:hypothetical protein
MKIKLYESLNIIMNEFFEIQASEVENFKDFIRMKYKSKIDNEILQKAAFNTKELLIKNIEVVD